MYSEWDHNKMLPWVCGSITSTENDGNRLAYLKSALESMEVIPPTPTRRLSWYTAGSKTLVRHGSLLHRRV